MRKTLGAATVKKYIHLLRDPRAVVYSWQRRGRTKGLEQWIEEMPLGSNLEYGSPEDLVDDFARLSATVLASAEIRQKLVERIAAQMAPEASFDAITALRTAGLGASAAPEREVRQ